MNTEIQWGKVFYLDCLDKEKGLFSLPSKSVDYCFTDPPFNNDISEGGISTLGRLKIRPNAIFYKDKKSDIKYQEWCSLWFNELKRICNIIIIHCGKKNLAMWCRIEEPYDIIFLHKKNAQSGGWASHYNRIYPILIYGKPKKKLMTDYLEYLSDMGISRKGIFLHPCPLKFDFWYDLIAQFQPVSVIDPFVGSGTTIEVCEKLKIKPKWIAYEIEEKFQRDIDKRLNRVRKQRTIERFLEVGK